MESEWITTESQEEGRKEVFNVGKHSSIVLFKERE